MTSKASQLACNQLSALPRDALNLLSAIRSYHVMLSYPLYRVMLPIDIHCIVQLSPKPGDAQLSPSPGDAPR